MFESQYRNRVTVFQPVKRGVSNDVTYREILDQEDGKAGGPAILNCRIERRGRRVLDTNGESITTDATMVFRIAKSPVITMSDVVVDEKGKAYKLADLEETSAQFGPGEFARAGLLDTVLPVPAQKDAGRPDLGKP